MYVHPSQTISTGVCIDVPSFQWHHLGRHPRDDAAYHLSTDLQQDTIATLQRPPANAWVAWRQARIARVIQEISTLMPANAARARSAADILMVPEMAGTLAVQGRDPALTAPQMCRMFRVSGELHRTAGMLVPHWSGRSRSRHRFLAWCWRMRSMSRRLAAGWGTDVTQWEDGGGPDAPDCAASEAVPPGSAGSTPAMTMEESDGEAEAVANVDGADVVVGRQVPESVETDARSTAEDVVTRLDQGAWLDAGGRASSGGRDGGGGWPGARGGWVVTGGARV